MFATGGFRLGIDFGTSNTVAVLGYPTGRLSVLLFDGSPTLPSVVCLDNGGYFLTGNDALHAARINPTAFEPHPKRLVDEGAALLGNAEVPVTELFRAVLTRVETEARRVAGEPLRETILTCPAAWATPRRSVLLDAAARAGLPGVRLLVEPVAAAQYFLGTGRATPPVGSATVIYDLGGGTFDATVVRRTPTGFEVLATEGLPQAGGLDIDAAIVDYLGGVYAHQAGDAWLRLTRPESAGDRRASRQLWDDVRAAKETLSRNSTTAIHLPILDRDAPLGREQLEELARPLLAATMTTTRSAITAAGVAPENIAATILVGGGSRIPLVATLLRRDLGLTPLAIEQPELVVAQGSLVVVPPAAVRPAPGHPVSALPISAHPVSGHPMSGPPMSGPPMSGPPMSGPPMMAQQGTPRPVGAMPQSVSTVPRPARTAPVWPPPVFVPVGAPAPTAGGAKPAKRGHPVRTALIVLTALALVAVGSVFGIQALLDHQRKAQVPYRDLAVGTSIKAMAVSADARTVAVTGYSGPVTLWDAVTLQKIDKVLPTVKGVKALAFHPNGQSMATLDYDGVSLWDLNNTNQPVATIETDFAEKVGYSPDGSRLAVVDIHGVSVWNLKTGKKVSQTDSTGRAIGIAMFAFSPDGNTIYTNDTAQVNGLPVYRVQAWNAATGKATGQPIDLGKAEAKALTVSPDGATLAVTSTAGTQLWNLKDPKAPTMVPHGTNLRYGVTFSRDGSRLVSTTSGGVRVLAAADLAVIADLPITTDQPQLALIGPDNHTVICGLSNRVRIWTLPEPTPTGTTSASTSPKPTG